MASAARKHTYRFTFGPWNISTGEDPFGPAARKALAPTGDLVERAAAAERFTAKSGSSLDIVAPAGLPVARLAILGVGKAGKLKAQDLVKLGGAAMGKVPSRAEEVAIFAEFSGGSLKPDQAAEIALGTQLLRENNCARRLCCCAGMGTKGAKNAWRTQRTGIHPCRKGHGLAG